MAGLYSKAAQVFLCLFVAKLAYPCYAPRDATTWGRPVMGIRLECDARLNLADFAAQITQKVGEPLEPSKVAESLKNLYGTGRFHELRADAESKGSGVELIFVGRATFFVGIVGVEGIPGAIETRALATATRLQLGQLLSDDELARAGQRVTAVLAENGYYEAGVSQRVLRNPQNQETEIIFSVHARSPARLSGVEFHGNPGVLPNRLTAVAGWRAGVHMTSARAERGLLKIQQFYVKHGWLLSTVNIENRSYDAQLHTEKLRVRAEAGPHVQVRVLGAKISASKLKDLLPVYREHVADDSALARGQQSLEDHFQQQGYVSAATTVEKVYDSHSNQLKITYTVKLGTRGEFAAIGFRGNTHVSSADLAGSLVPASNASSREKAIFSREILERDVKILTALYQSRGFPDAGVKYELNNRDEGQPGRFSVTFQVTEGPGIRVRQLMLQGVDAETQKKVWPLMLTRPGQPYSPANAQTDRESLLNYFADNGYTQAAVSWHASASSAAHEVDVEYRIAPGAQEKIQRVVVLGNQHTRPGIIRRELTFAKGEPLSQSKLLESQRRLYELGVFNQVRIATQGPEGSETEKTVLVNVEEARRWTVSYGGGIEAQRLGSNQPQGQFRASPRLSLDVTRLNAGGRAQTLALRGRLSNLQKGGAISYLLPRFLTRRDLSLRFNGLVDRSRDVLTFTAEREEAAVSLEKRYSPATLLLGRFSYRRVLVDSTTLRISPQQIPLFSRPARVGMLGVSYVNDHRDNPSDATQGSYSLADAGISWQSFASEANFLRFAGQNATYYRLGSHLIFARNSRFAVESPFGALRSITVSGGAGTKQVIRTHEIPLPERFFLGGSEAHRGFSINQAGPRDAETGFPIGGNALFLNSLELRVPIVEDRFGLVFFHDAGNVFSTIRKMRLFKLNQSSPTDFDYGSHAVGLGFRYRTPVGPLRFDVGYNLNPPRFPVRLQQGLEVRRLSQFQFFLSIGQSF